MIAGSSPVGGQGYSIRPARLTRSPTLVILPITRATALTGAYAMLATLAWGRLRYGIRLDGAGADQATGIDHQQLRLLSGHAQPGRAGCG